MSDDRDRDDETDADLAAVVEQMCELNDRLLDRVEELQRDQIEYERRLRALETDDVSQALEETDASDDGETHETRMFQ